ncbi:MAG: hypothetical protein MMC33_001321 [Icmadophila ericetorum]|nr:hypothetical protein [Icmadophila ericetorum]
MAKTSNSKTDKATIKKNKAKMEERQAPFELPPTRTLYKTTTTILVGPDNCPITYQVHTPILIKHSTFFAAALRSDSPFVESVSASNTVRLPDCIPKTFEYFVQWLYTKSLAHEGLDGKSPPEFFQLVKLWKLAGYLQAEECRNAVLDKVARVAEAKNSVPCPDDISALWDEDGAGAGDTGNGGLRDLVLDLFVWKKTKSLLLKSEGYWDEQFMRELVVKLKEKEPVLAHVPMIHAYKDPVLMCQTYHEHRTTERCHEWTKEKRESSEEKQLLEKKS